MTTPDLLIHGCQLLLEDQLVTGEIGIDAGRITHVRPATATPRAEHIIRAEGLVALPGLIDAHCHVYDPDYQYREDYASGTRSALLGGITTILDMPLVNHVADPGTARRRIAVGERLAHCDFGMHAGFMNAQNLSQMAKLAALGIRSFKTFTCPPFEADWETIARILEQVASAGVATFHAEDGEMVRSLQARFVSSGRRDAYAPHDTRPPEAESRAIERIAAAARPGIPIHIAHLSSNAGLASIQQARRGGLDITVETCPQYLLLSRADIDRFGPYAKMTPGLKTVEDQQALWQGVASGAVDIIASDHAPCPREEKEVGREDIWRAWAGIPGVATMLPLLITYGVLQERLSLIVLQRCVATTVARRFGLAGKGTLQPGNDADITLVSLRRRRRVASAFLYKVGWSPFEGMELAGWPEVVLARGELVVKDGDVIAQAGRGRYVAMQA